MARYIELTEGEYEEMQTAIVDTLLMNPIIEQIITTENMPYKTETTWNKSEVPTDRDGIWSLATVTLKEEFNLTFTPTTEKVLRLQMMVSIPNYAIKVSKTQGESLDAYTVREAARVLTKELEKFIFQGPTFSGDQTGTTIGLVNEAANESTYDTVKWAAAAGPYNTVSDMRGQLIADAHGLNFPLDLIVDTTLYPYLLNLPATDSNFNEFTRIKEKLLNGGNIYISDQLPAATSDDGVALLVENQRDNYVLKTPQPLGLSDNTWDYDRPSDSLLNRVEGYYALQVMRPNAICKHVNVDLA